MEQMSRSPRKRIGEEPCKLNKICEGLETEIEWLNKIVGDHSDFKFAVFGVEGYGTCFFHSLCYSINYKGYAKASKAKRKELADGLRCKLKDSFTRARFRKYNEEAVSPASEEDYEKYLVKFCKPKAWADEIMIRHTAEMFKLNILFIRGDTPVMRFYCGVHAKMEDRPTMMVLWVHRTHFEPIVRWFPKEHKVLGLMRKERAGDRRVLQSVLKQYRSQCHIK